MKKLKLTKELKEKIKCHAIQSMYRLNAKTADCYAFTLHETEEWQGGWDWSNRLVDTDAEFILMLESGEFIKRW